MQYTLFALAALATTTLAQSLTTVAIYPVDPNVAPVAPAAVATSAAIPTTAAPVVAPAVTTFPAIAPLPAAQNGTGLPTSTGTQAPLPFGMTTTVVTVLTTVCPSPTSLTFNGITYTVTLSTTLTITDCPCTVTVPITSTVIPVPTVLPAPASNSSIPAPFAGAASGFSVAQPLVAAFVLAVGAAALL